MIYALMATIATLAVALIVRRHRPLVYPQAATVLHGLLVVAGTPGEWQRAGLVALAAVSAYAYLSVWLPSRRSFAAGVLAAYALAGWADGPWVAMILSAGLGALAFARGHHDRGITDLVASSLLLTDLGGVVMSLGHSAPIADLGRTQAVLITVIQAVYLMWVLKKPASPRTRSPDARERRAPPE